MGINDAPGDSDDHVAEAPPEPTPKEIADACREVVADAGLEDMLEEIERSADSEEAIGVAFTVLLEADIEDPEAFLIEKGILKSGISEEAIPVFIGMADGTIPIPKELQKEAKKRLSDLGFCRDDEEPSGW